MKVKLLHSKPYLKGNSTNFFFCHTRIKEFAKDEIDFTLATTLEFNTPLADLSDVKTMMDSINVVPGLMFKPHVCVSWYIDEGSY